MARGALARFFMNFIAHEKPSFIVVVMVAVFKSAIANSSRDRLDQDCAKPVAVRDTVENSVEGSTASVTLALTLNPTLCPAQVSWLAADSPPRSDACRDYGPVTSGHTVMGGWVAVCASRAPRR